MLPSVQELLLSRLMLLPDLEEPFARKSEFKLRFTSKVTKFTLREEKITSGMDLVQSLVLMEKSFL